MATVSEQRVERLISAYGKSEAAELRAMREKNQSLSEKEKSAQVAKLVAGVAPVSEQDLLKVNGANLGPKPILMAAAVDLLRSYAMAEDGKVLVSDEDYVHFVDSFLNAAPILGDSERVGLLGVAHVLHLAAYLYTDEYGTWFFEAVEKVGETTRAQLAEKRGNL